MSSPTFLHDMITIDTAKCIGCGTCIPKCVRDLLYITEEGTAAIKNPRACFGCLHCAAICPVDAVLFQDGPTGLEDPIPAIDPGLTSQLEDLAKVRRSIRVYQDKPVPKEDIEAALRMADWAPATKNDHVIKYYVLRDRAVMEKMTEIIVQYSKENDINPEIIYNLGNGLNSVFTSAHTAIMAYTEKGLNPQTDAAIALSYAELSLVSKGYGTCWAGYLARFMETIPGLKELLGIPAEHRFYAAIVAGYPDEQYLRTPVRTKPAKITWL